jgi:hypothetical protein
MPWRSCQCCQAELTIRITSWVSNGFASTSHAPRFRASAQRWSSASREVTIKSGGSGRNEIWSNISHHLPVVISASNSTMGNVACRNTKRAEATAALGISVQSDLKMRSRETQSSPLELTKRTPNIPVGRFTNAVGVSSVTVCFLMLDYLWSVSHWTTLFRDANCQVQRRGPQPLDFGNKSSEIEDRHKHHP